MKHNGWSIDPRKRKLIEDFWNQFEFCEIADAGLMEKLTDLRNQVTDALYSGDLRTALSRTFEAMLLLDEAGGE
jgi:hypothetical protein